MARLITRRVLGNGPFAECGPPTGLYHDRHGHQLAVTSSFWSMYWHGRSARPGYYRVSVYDASSLRHLAVLDRPRFRINDVAFHPRETLLAIATGNYDGGFYYEGELLLWDLRTGETISLLDQNREVTSCQFDETGQTLQLTLRPPSDWEDLLWAPELRQRFLLTTVEREAWESRRPGAIVVADLTFTIIDGTDVPPRYHSRAGYPSQQERDVQPALERIAAQLGQHYEPRWAVWDVAWTPKGEILAVRNNTALEHWSEHGERVQHLPDSRDGVQLLLAPSGDIYVNLSGRLFTDRWVPVSGIERITLDTGERRALAAVDFPALLSINDAGALLARDTHHREHFDTVATSGSRTFVTEGPEGFSVTLRPPPRPTEHGRDCVVLAGQAPPKNAERWQQFGDLVVSDALSLGYYDSGNHYLRIDGAPQLYFIGGWASRPEPWRDRWVYRVDPHSLLVEHLFPVDWEPDQHIHVRVNCGVYLPGEGGGSLVLACHRRNGQGTVPGGTLLLRRAVADGAVLWETVVDAEVTALVMLPERGLLVFAQRSGSVGVLSAETGAIELIERVTLDGVSCSYLSLAAQGDRILAGSLDGRIVVYELTA